MGLSWLSGETNTAPLGASAAVICVLAAMGTATLAEIAKGPLVASAGGEAGAVVGVDAVEEGTPVVVVASFLVGLGEEQAARRTPATTSRGHGQRRRVEG